jgi:hypothetical protein
METLSGPERMIQTAMKLMGFKPQEMLDRFQIPIETAMQGIKDVDKRLSNLENKMDRILAILEKDMTNDGPILRVIDGRTSSDDSPSEYSRITG